MMLMLSSANAEITWNEELEVYTLTRNDLEGIDFLLEEGMMNKILVEDASKTIMGIKMDLIKLGTIIDDIKAENRRLKRQRTFYIILAGGSVLASVLILLFK